jgi:outer membrane protein assembly factor BamB
VRARAAGVLAAGALLGACGEPVAPAVRPVRLVVTASDTIQVTGATLAFSAVAVDSAGAVVADVPIAWSVGDPQRGRITAAGVFTGGPDSGQVYVRAVVENPALVESLAVRVVVPGTLKWRWAMAEVGGVTMTDIGGPALGHDGTVYVVVVRPPQVAPWYALLAALTPTGSVRWTVPLEGVDYNYPVVTPAGDVLVAAQRVYVVRPAGTVRWQALMEANHPGFKSGAIGDGVAFVTHGYNLSVLSLATGETVWQSPRSPVSSWLVPPTVVGTDRVYAKHTRDTLFAFQQSDGAILKVYQDPDTSADMRVFGAGTVPVGARFYLPTHSRLTAFDTAGPLLWMSEQADVGTPEPVVLPDGVLYVQNSRWGLQVINPDGTGRWKKCTLLPNYHCAEEPYWNWYGGGALGEGGIFYGAGWDRFFAYDTVGTALWHYQADSAGVPQPFIGAPAIGPDGTVYTFTSTHVYAFWASAPPEPDSPWPMWRHDAQRTGWVR